MVLKIQKNKRKYTSFKDDIMPSKLQFACIKSVFSYLRLELDRLIFFKNREDSSPVTLFIIEAFDLTLDIWAVDICFLCTNEAPAVHVLK